LSTGGAESSASSAGARQPPPGSDRPMEGTRTAFLFAERVRTRVEEALGPRAVGVYVGGSLVLGDYAAGRSDVDIAVIAKGPLTQAEKEALVTELELVSRDCPTRGLELVVYTRAEAAQPSWPPRFELNLNAGPRMPLNYSFDPESEPSHWFVVDLAILREWAVPLVGPPAAESFGPVARPHVLEALEDSLTWHLENETRSPSSVLNACRAWRYAEEQVWTSKGDAAAWVQARLQTVPIVEDALAARDAEELLDQAPVRAFMARATDIVAKARARDLA
jgi:Domain of unknown function (DUF4111)/Nucleotidyltransferase domain